MVVAENGNLIIININGTITDVSAQFARDVITTIENIDHFIIPAGHTVNVLGTTIFNAKRIQIDGTLNGSGGGYAGGARRTSYDESGRNNGSSPPSTAGHGQGGWTLSGGAGAGHGKLSI